MLPDTVAAKCSSTPPPAMPAPAMLKLQTQCRRSLWQCFARYNDISGWYSRVLGRACEWRVVHEQTKVHMRLTCADGAQLRVF